MLLRATGALLFWMIVSGCGVEFQVNNSFSGDEDSFSRIDGSALFLKANSVFRRQCSECHSAYSAYTEDEWIAQGLIVVGSADDSVLFGRIRGSGTGGSEDMPPQTTLSTAELQAIQEWINGI